MLQIPASLGALAKMEVLDLSDNCFNGCLPPALESLVLLRSFSASNNELSGEVPAFLGSLPALTTLALDGNKFEGAIPPEIGQLTSLERLYLERNELVSNNGRDRLFVISERTDSTRASRLSFIAGSGSQASRTLPGQFWRTVYSKCNCI